MSSRPISLRRPLLAAGATLGRPMCPRHLAVLVLVVVIASATAASAQQPGGQGGSRGGMGAGREGPRPDATRGAPAAEAPLSPGALVQKQLDQLEDDLELGPAQRGAWNAYADRVQKLADAIARNRFEARASPPAQSSAPQQLDQLASGMRSRMAIVDEIVDLARTFYATLTTEQKAIADPRLALPLSVLATGVAPAGMVDGVSRGERGRKP